jgi:hypothetical protein
MLNYGQKVQECDATDDDSSTTAGLQKKQHTKPNMTAWETLLQSG